MGAHWILLSWRLDLTCGGGKVTFGAETNDSCYSYSPISVNKKSPATFFFMASLPYFCGTNKDGVMISRGFSLFNKGEKKLTFLNCGLLSLGGCEIFC